MSDDSTMTDARAEFILAIAELELLIRRMRDISTQDAASKVANSLQPDLIASRNAEDAAGDYQGFMDRDERHGDY